MCWSSGVGSSTGAEQYDFGVHHYRAEQYDFGKPSTFSAMKQKMSCGLTGAMRGSMDSRK